MYRKLQESSIGSKPNVFVLWVHLLLMANHKPQKFVWNKEEITINRGQVLTGRNKLSLITGLTPQNIRTALTTLKSTNRITSKPYSKFSVFTINNYDQYQGDSQQLTNKLANNQPTTNQQLTTYKNDKNDKNDKRKGENGRFAPPPLDDVLGYCRERKNGIDADRFVDFYTSRGWMMGKTKMKDWKAAVRTWEKSNNKPKEPSRYPVLA